MLQANQNEPLSSSHMDAPHTGSNYTRYSVTGTTNVSKKKLRCGGEGRGGLDIDCGDGEVNIKISSPVPFSFLLH